MLLHKLHFCGVRGIACILFRTYLMGKSQFVCKNHIKLVLEPIQCEVLNGLVLCLLLFVLYINYVEWVTSNNHRLFVSNTCHVIHNPFYQKLIHKVEIETCCTNNWMKGNKLTLNPNKSNLIIYLPKQNQVTTQA